MEEEEKIILHPEWKDEEESEIYISHIQAVDYEGFEVLVINTFSRDSSYTAHVYGKVKAYAENIEGRIQSRVEPLRLDVQDRDRLERKIREQSHVRQVTFERKDIERYLKDAQLII